MTAARADLAAAIRAGIANADSYVQSDDEAAADAVLACLADRLGDEALREAVIDSWRILKDDRHLAYDDADAALSAVRAALLGSEE